MDCCASLERLLRGCCTTRVISMVALPVRNGLPTRRSSSLRSRFAASILLFAMPTAPAQVLAQSEPPAIPVAVAAPILKRVTQWDEYSGRFAASEIVWKQVRMRWPDANLHRARMT